MTTTLGEIDSVTRILGDKWTPKLLRYFLEYDSVRFCQLQDLAGTINPRTLSARLVKLENEGIVLKRRTDSSRCEYMLTNKGKDLLPIIASMSEWSEKHQ